MPVNKSDGPPGVFAAYARKDEPLSEDLDLRGRKGKE